MDKEKYLRGKISFVRGIFHMTWRLLGWVLQDMDKELKEEKKDEDG